MATMIRLELLKLRRTSLLWVGTAAGMLAILVSFYLAAADHMTQYTVAIFMGNLAANNRSSLFPFVAVLTVGRMMEWERTSRTLPGLLTVPVRFPALLGAKLAAGLPLTVGYSLLQWVLGILCCLVLRLPGIAAMPLLADLLVLTGSNLCVYVAVLPIIALAAQFAGGYIPGTVFAVFYGFCSIFISGHGLAAAYPVSAVTMLLERDRTQPTAQDTVCAAVSLVCTAALAVVLTATARNRTREKPPAAPAQKRRGR